MCQASSTVSYPSPSSSRSSTTTKKSSSATAAVSLRKPVTPSATFRLSMRRDRDSPSSVPPKLSLRRRLHSNKYNHDGDVFGFQHLQPAAVCQAVVDDNEPTPTLTTFNNNNKAVAPVLLTPRSPDLVLADGLGQHDDDGAASLHHWLLSPPLLEPLSRHEGDEYRSLPLPFSMSLPDAILIPDF
jgi:hypothetical protein